MEFVHQIVYQCITEEVSFLKVSPTGCAVNVVRKSKEARGLIYKEGYQCKDDDADC